MIWRLLLAAVLGGIIGFERSQKANTSAGLRTHATVAVASALIVIISAHGFDEVIDKGRIVLDPSRIAAQVVSGIGFLGAGIIIFKKHAVHGLTTAASIWAVAAIGLAAGCGMIAESTEATAIIVFILKVIKFFEKRFLPQTLISAIELTITDVEKSDEIIDSLKQAKWQVSRVSFKHQKHQKKAILKVEGTSSTSAFRQALKVLMKSPLVTAVNYDFPSRVPYDHVLEEMTENDAENEEDVYEKGESSNSSKVSK